MQTVTLTQAEISAHHFKNVETYCGVARLALQNAMESASHVSNEGLKAEALLTLEGTLEDIIALYRGGKEKKMWQVETLICGLWQNIWFTYSSRTKGETLDVFETKVEATTALEEFLADQAWAFDSGVMDERYDAENFRVVEVVIPAV